MNRNALMAGVFAAVMSLGSAQLAQAAIIDFNAHSDDFGNPILDSGFTFNFVSQGWGVFKAPDGCCNVNDDGTTALYADGSLDGPAHATMVKTGGGVFDVSALDAATYWRGATGVLKLYGAVSGGGSVFANLNVTSSFQHFSLSNFTNLTSLTFSDSQNGGFLSAPGFGVDNINLAQSGAPEPASWALMIGGFGLAGAALRRRRAVVAA